MIATRATAIGSSLAAVGLALVALSGLATESRALPSFSRASGRGCDACHDRVPRLNAAGMRFLANGYRVPGSPAPATAAPLSVMMTMGYGVAGPGRGPLLRTDLAAGRERESVMEWHLAGATRWGLSGHLAQRVGTTAGTLEPRVAALRWGAYDATRALGVTLGLHETGLPFLASSRRIGLAPYRAPVSFMAEGVELDGATRGWSGALGVTEDHRARPPGAAVSAFGAHLQDPYFWVMRGGERLAIGGRMWFDRQDSDLSFHSWLQHMQHEVAARVRWGRAEVTPAYVLDRYDDRPVAEIHDKHHLAMLEVDAPLDARGRWWVAGRYEHEHRPATGYTPDEEHGRATLDLGFDPRPGARLALECSDATRETGGRRDARLDAFVRVGY